MVELKHFQAEHFEAAMEIERALFPRDAWSADLLRSELTLVGESREYWVALDGAEVVGYCGMFYLPPEADVQTIAVKPSHQRQGLGTRMLREMMASAARLGCTHMMLEVAVENVEAQSLYKRLGFRELGVRQNYYGPGLDCVVMECNELVSVDND